MDSTRLLFVTLRSSPVFGVVDITLLDTVECLINHVVLVYTPRGLEIDVLDFVAK